MPIEDESFDSSCSRNQRYDPREEVKRAAAERWVAAVNAEGSYGSWVFALIKKTTDVSAAITKIVSSFTAEIAH